MKAITSVLATIFLAVAMAAGSARPAAAQAAVTTSDIQRLQDAVYDAGNDISQVRGRDSALASQLQNDLDEARDEVVYLKVKLRKNEAVSRSDYSNLRDRIDGIRSRARGETSSRTPPSSVSGASDGIAPAPSSPPPPGSRSSSQTSSSSPYEVPVGTEFDVRLQNSLSSSTAQVEDRFEATTLVDLLQNDRVVVPAGSTMRGVVSSVNKAGRVERKGSLTVAFDQITINGRNYPVRATVTQALESEGIKGEAGKIGAGAGVGAIIGGILGGVKGALAGILIGGGGTIAATEGKDVDLPAGTTLRVRLDSGLNTR